MVGKSRPTEEEQLELLERHMNPGFARLFRLLGLTVSEVRAEGSIVWDTSGNEYIDLASGVGSLNMGHRHPRVVKAVREQLERVALSSRLLLSENQLVLAQRLAELTPGDLEYSFFTHSGTEAVEGALKFARMSTGRKEFIGAKNAFHGKSMGALSASGKESYQKPFGPLLPGFRHVPFGDSTAVEEALTDDTAAVILEPIEGEAGVIVPPDDYLPRVRELCDRNGSLLILDEVQTGMGRTGRNFACEHWGVAPDIMTLAKSLGGGVMPLGAIVGTERVFSIFDANPLIHSSTTGGNPLACAAGLAALDVLVEERLAENAERKGKYVMERLHTMSERLGGILADVRGKGLHIGIEFIDDAFGGLYFAELVKEKVLTMPAFNDFRMMRIMPALNIPDAVLEEGMNRVERVMRRAAELHAQL